MAKIKKSKHIDDLNEYVEGVLSGKIISCKWVKLACKRHQNDLKKIKDKKYPYIFDEKKAERVINFLELLPHTKGEWAKKKPGDPDANKMKQEAWQKFLWGSVFGWVKKEDGMRRFKVVYLCVPRKNGKSNEAAGIGLYMFAADNEEGAEVYSGATSEKQAFEVFRPARLMSLATPEFTKHFGIGVGAKNLHIPLSSSRFEPVVGKPGDGASPSCAIVDEFHEHSSDELYDTMITGMGARNQPLMLVITTAGSNIACPCYALQLEVQQMLEGSNKDEELFGLIYTIDEDDDWTAEEALVKANPNYGISVKKDFLISQQKQAIKSSRKQNVFKTKHLNMWVTARSPYFNIEKWNKLSEDFSEDDFENEECVIGVDLASKKDLTAVIKLFYREIDDKKHWYILPRFYVPESQIDGEDKAHYQSWVNDGYLIPTDGNIINYNQIKEDIKEDSEKHQINDIGYDPWGATQLALQLQDDEGLTVTEVRQNVANLSEPMKWIDALIEDELIHHDGNPVLTWCLSNVTAKVDANDNVYPRKERDEYKIDGAVALIIAMARAEFSQDEDKGPSIYEQRGILMI
jgi:phage terminase large subunit-like protein